MNLYRLDSNTLKEKFLAQKQIIIFCFCSAFFWGLLAHAYGFLHSSFSHDVLNAFTATPREEVLKIEMGRYLVPLYRMLLRGPVTVPWLVGLLGLLWTAIAVVLVVQIFNIRSKALILLTGGIMTTNFAYIAQIATYMHEYDCNALGLLFAVLSVYLWNQDKKAFSVIAGALCLTASISLYQAYFAVAVTLIVWKSIMDLFDDKPVPKVFNKGLRGILMLLVGCLMYLLLGKVIGFVTDLTLADRTNVLDADGENLIAVYLGLIKPMISYLGRNMLHKVFYSNVFDACVYLLVALLALSALRVFILKRYRFDRVLLILLLVAMMPFAMTCVFFLAKGEEMHDLTTYAIWMFYVLILIFAFRLCEEDLKPDWKARLVRSAACVLVGVVLWQNVILANTAYIKKEMEANAALSTMTRVVSRLEDREDYVMEETPIAFIGTTQLTEDIYGMDPFGTIIGLCARSAISMDVSMSHYNAYKAYFNYVLQTPALFCSDEVHSQLKADERVAAMPAYPHKDSMAMIDGVMVIKMG